MMIETITSTMAVGSSASIASGFTSLLTANGGAIDDGGVIDDFNIAKTLFVGGFTLASSSIIAGAVIDIKDTANDEVASAYIDSLSLEQLMEFKTLLDSSTLTTEDNNYTLTRK